MRVRWAIEHGLDRDPDGTVYLSLVDENGDDVGSSSVDYASEADARATAEQSAEDLVTLRWKPAPTDWQPDTYLVSQFYDDPTRRRG